MIFIRMHHEDIEIVTEDECVYSLKRSSLPDLHKAINLIIQLPAKDPFNVLEIRIQ